MSTLYVDNLQPNLGSRVMAAGHVVQTQYSKISAQTQFSSASYSDATNFSVTITPTSTSSLIRICIFTKTGLNNTSLNAGQDYRLRRGTTDIEASTWMNYLNRADYTADFYPPLLIDIIDAPSTTSATTYSLQGRTYAGSGGANWTIGAANGGSGRGFMIVQEIAQ